MSQRNTLKFRIPTILKTCIRIRDIRKGKSIHGHVIRSISKDLTSDMFVGTGLVDLYSAAGYPVSAASIFYSYSHPDIALFTSMISAYQKNSMPYQALCLFSTLFRNPLPRPNSVTLSVILSAITQLRAFLPGKSTHGYAIRKGFLFDLPLKNSLLNMYSKLNYSPYVENLFSSMTNSRDLITWSCILGFYSRHGRAADALRIYKEMICTGLSPNQVTILSALQACSATGNIAEARILHQHALRQGFELKEALGTALIDAYMKCSCIKEAEIVFSMMPSVDLVSMSAMLGGYSHNGHPNKSVEIFRQMMAVGLPPDAVAMAKLLSACSQMGLFRQVICFHSFLLRSGFGQQPFVVAALVDFYSKCGIIDDAVSVFAEVEVKDCAIWTAMIGGLGMNGLGRVSLKVFEKMIESSVDPTELTFASLLSACSHSGLLQEGMNIFREMDSVYGVTPGIDHMTIMVDLLGRGGELSEALKLVEKMQNACCLINLHAWKAFLAGCRSHGHIEASQMALQMMYDLGIDLTLLGKRPGVSLIEVNGKICWFLADDQTHQEIQKIHFVLRELGVMIKEKGFTFPIGTLEDSQDKMKRDQSV